MMSMLTGSDCGVAQNENHLLVEWRDEQNKRVVFSFSQYGNAISAHFACEKESLREVKPAIMEFIDWAFWAFPWSRVIIAKVDRPSVKRMILKCGFDWLLGVGEVDVYMRKKNEFYH